MGDEGKLFVSDEVIPAYKTLLRDADLILPNQFELEVLTGIQITSEAELIKAITVAHKEYLVPHVIVTSVSFDPKSPHISVIGSSRRSGGTPRLFKVNVPSIDCYFTGPGDMFAALTVVRLREAVLAMGLENTTCWMPADDVEGPDLPIAKSTEKVLASMHVVLSKTKKARDEALESMGGPMGVLEKEKDSEKRTLLRKMKAAEVRLVRNFRDLLEPNVVYKAELLEI
ncbi:MAG: putative pyridoxal kinase [Icmadophila ericetorum]|nr:putative pyridoxal kinase [Icmadophila ericetorum]